MTRQALFRLKLKGIHRYIRDSEVYDEIVTTLSSTDMTDPTIKKMQKRPKLVKKTKKTIYRADTHIPLNVRFKDELKISYRNSQNLAGHRRNNNTTCSHHYYYYLFNA